MSDYFGTWKAGDGVTRRDGIEPDVKPVKKKKPKTKKKAKKK